jgi:hypothetical protein
MELCAAVYQVISAVLFPTGCFEMSYPKRIEEGIKRRSNSDDPCYHSVQNLTYPRLLSKSVKIGIHKTIILPLVLYGCETWSLTLRREHRLREFENRVLRLYDYLGRRRMK